MYIFIHTQIQAHIYLRGVDPHPVPFLVGLRGGVTGNRGFTPCVEIFWKGDVLRNSDISSYILKHTIYIKNIYIYNLYHHHHHHHHHKLQSTKEKVQNLLTSPSFPFLFQKKSFSKKSAAIYAAIFFRRPGPRPSLSSSPGDVALRRWHDLPGSVEHGTFPRGYGEQPWARPPFWGCAMYFDHTICLL